MRTKQEKALNDYINLKHNQAECTGFIDGYDAGIKDADEFACGFAEWLVKNASNCLESDKAIKNNEFEYIIDEGEIIIVTATELLEIFKKEQDGK